MNVNILIFISCLVVESITARKGVWIGKSVNLIFKKIRFTYPHPHPTKKDPPLKQKRIKRQKNLNNTKIYGLMTPNILLCFFKTLKIIILSLSIIPCLKKMHTEEERPRGYLSSC